MASLGIFELRFSKSIGLFEINSPKFVEFQNFAKKEKCLNMGSQTNYLGIFVGRILKNYCHIWKQHIQIFHIPKFREKAKVPKFATDNALFGYFWARILKN